jgi:hypothetical protein
MKLRFEIQRKKVQEGFVTLARAEIPRNIVVIDSVIDFRDSVGTLDSI